MNIIKRIQIIFYLKRHIPRRSTNVIIEGDDAKLFIKQHFAIINDFNKLDSAEIEKIQIRKKIALENYKTLQKYLENNGTK